jgi:hypothetical protein
MLPIGAGLPIGSKFDFGIASMITLDQLCWIATAAYAVHALEEYTFNWKAWAHGALRLQCDWPTFYLATSVVMVLGIVSAQIAPQMPILALCFPALLLINATFFHVLPVLLMRGRFSPGLLTAVLLFYPIGILCYRAVFQTGLLTGRALLSSFLGGALLMAVPLVFLKLKNRPYFLPAKRWGSSSGSERNI